MRETNRHNNGNGAGQAYTGKTIVLKHERDAGRPPAILPNIPPVSPDMPRSQERAAERIARKRARRKGSTPPWSFRLILRRVWLGIRLAILLVVALCITGAILFYYQVGTLADTVVVPDVRAQLTLATPLVGGTNVLLIGVDERPDHPEEGVRSDTLILVHLDAAGRWVSMLSIPRDTQVELLDIGTTKINVAYGQGYARAEELYGTGTTPQQGGMALAAQTVEDFLDLPERGMSIDYTAQVNFDGFVQVIDAVGGITVDVPTVIVDEEYPTPDFGFKRVEFQPGPQHMDGETALIYARTRHADSDFGRAQRQQQVVHALVAAIKSDGWLHRMMQLPAVLDSLKSREGHPAPVLTTMPVDRLDILAGLMVLASGLTPDSLQQVHINPETVFVTEIGSNLVWDVEGVHAQVDQMLKHPQD